LRNRASRTRERRLIAAAPSAAALILCVSIAPFTRDGAARERLYETWAIASGRHLGRSHPKSTHRGAPHAQTAPTTRVRRVSVTMARQLLALAALALAGAAAVVPADEFTNSKVSRRIDATKHAVVSNTTVRLTGKGGSKYYLAFTEAEAAKLATVYAEEDAASGERFVVQRDDNVQQCVVAVLERGGRRAARPTASPTLPRLVYCALLAAGRALCTTS